MTAFFVFIFLCDMLIPLLMLTIGRACEKHPPKDINSVIGYRTPRSMMNNDTWRFAHVYCGRLWVKWGAAMIAPTVIAHIPFIRSSTGTVGTLGVAVEMVQLAVLIWAVVRTEKKLAREFDEKGERRKTDAFSA